MGRSDWSIGRRLAVLVALLAVPLNVLVVTALAHLAAIADSAHRATLQYTARSLAAAVDAQLAKHIALAQVLASSPAVLETNLAAFEAEARRAFLDLHETWALVADLEGRQLINLAARTGQELPHRSPVAFAAQQRAVATRSIIVSDIAVGPVVRDWVTTINLPIMRDGEPYRVLAVTMSARSFFRLLNAQSMPAGWLTGITDTQGRFIARVPDHERHVGEPASQGWRKVRGRDGVFEFLSLEGDPIVQANALSSLSGWSIGVAEKKSQVLNPAWHTIGWAALIGGAISAMSLGLAVWLSRRIRAPILELQHKATKLVAGERVDLHATLPEVKEVWSALTTAVADRKRAEAASAHLAAIVESSSDAIASKSLDGIVLSWNAAAVRMFGYQPEEMIGHPVTQLIPADRQSEEAVILEKIRSGQRMQAHETVRLRKDGSAFPVSLTISPIHDRAGRTIAASKIVRDITERKRREARIELLMRELNHRSKNMMGLVQSIARHTVASSPEAFIDRFGKRIQALAANQDLLVKSDWQGTDLGELVRAQLGHFEDLVGDRVAPQGPSVRVCSEAAQCIGMAIHELATNAVKYGALSVPEGKVVVAWRLELGDAGERFAISWEEHGGPPMREPSRQGFGTTILTTMARMALGADVVLDYAAAGLAWRLTCHADRALERLHAGAT